MHAMKHCDEALQDCATQLHACYPMRCARSMMFHKQPLIGELSFRGRTVLFALLLIR